MELKTHRIHKIRSCARQIANYIPKLNSALDILTFLDDLWRQHQPLFFGIFNISTRCHPPHHHHTLPPFELENINYKMQGEFAFLLDFDGRVEIIRQNRSGTEVRFFLQEEKIQSFDGGSCTFIFEE